jgi:membrane-bound metal-dependent hydrolase YbcI (DUF457 family)
VSALLLATTAAAAAAPAKTVVLALRLLTPPLELDAEARMFTARLGAATCAAHLVLSLAMALYLFYFRKPRIFRISEHYHVLANIR